VAEPLDQTRRDPIKLGRALSDIQRYALAKVNLDGAVQLHRLVQAVLARRMNDEQRASLRKGAEDLLGARTRGEVSAKPATVVILTALGLEFEAVRAHLVDRDARDHPAGTVFEVGRLAVGAATRIALAVVGTGTAGAAAIAEQAITEFAPVAVLFVGIAGALKANIGLGDVVVATKVYGLHGGKEEADHFHARPEAWPAPYRLEQLARRVASDGAWAKHIERRPPVHFKPIASGEVVLNSRTTQLAQQINRTYNDAVAIENESAGAAKACHLREVAMLAIRGISDNADGDKHAAEQGGWPVLAATNAAAFAAAVVSALSAR
jgi:nucleoside phosphorylase